MPAGRLTLGPPHPSPVSAVPVEGLRISTDLVTIELGAAGMVVEVSGTSLGRRR